jgi:hypothetical protein
VAASRWGVRPVPATLAAAVVGRIARGCAARVGLDGWTGGQPGSRALAPVPFGVADVVVRTGGRPSGGALLRSRRGAYGSDPRCIGQSGGAGGAACPAAGGLFPWERARRATLRPVRSIPRSDRPERAMAARSTPKANEAEGDGFVHIMLFFCAPWRRLLERCQVRRSAHFKSPHVAHRRLAAVPGLQRGSTIPRRPTSPPMTYAASRWCRRWESSSAIRSRPTCGRRWATTSLLDQRRAPGRPDRYGHQPQPAAPAALAARRAEPSRAPACHHRRLGARN